MTIASRPLFRSMLFIIIGLILAGCTALKTHHLNSLYGQSEPRPERIVSHDSVDGRHFLNEVQPIIEKRCAVCHGCYDAPCQLKMTSPAGIDRGAHTDLVYNAARLLEAKPMRLGQDAQSTEEWRAMGFYPVLNERRQSPAANRNASLMHAMLELKEDEPLPNDKLLANSFDLSLNRKQTCEKVEGFYKYEKNNPLGGMPYGIPGISDDELDILRKWITAGAKMAWPAEPVVPLQSRIKQWEHMLNASDLRSQLVARYIYEHLYLASLYFEDVSSERFFRLVRSSTPPGEPVKIIATRRPFEDPGVQRVFYRILPMDETLLHKTHMPYALNKKRWDNIQTWFFNNEYTVNALPDYANNSANPFVTFKDLPAQARYNFMLEEAQFTIMGFIKGPVCRGNTALNVINDHFWVYFVDPDSLLSKSDQFLMEQSAHMMMPAEAKSFTETIGYWMNYSKRQSVYLEAKSKALEKLFQNTKLELDEKLIWDGDGVNDNAALTVFRHYDSATVLKGLVGQIPQTAWVIDYSLLESIHYLLVAGFDVYGNLSHQALTRLYMDFLRMEGEFNFLALLPEEERYRLRDYWYRDASEDVKSYLYGSRAYLNYPPGIQYKTDEPVFELVDILKKRLKPVLNNSHNLDHPDVPSSHRDSLSTLMSLQGKPATLMPEASIILVKGKNGKEYIYTLTSNLAYSSLTSMLAEQKNRLPKEDNLTVIRGIGTAYPSVYLSVSEDQLDNFTKRITVLKNEADYSLLLDSYGIRRTDEQFWSFSDAIHKNFKQFSPISYGLLDYNRLENR